MSACWTKKSGMWEMSVALVAATSEQIAEEAFSLIDVEYEVLPAVFDIDSALKPDAPLLYEELKNNIIPGGTPIYGPKLPSGRGSRRCRQGICRSRRHHRRHLRIRKHAQCSAGRSRRRRRILGTAQQGHDLWDQPGAVYGQGHAISRIQPGIGNPQHRASCRRQLRHQVHVLAGSSLCHHPGPGHADGRSKSCLPKKSTWPTSPCASDPASMRRVGMKKDGTITAIQGTWYVDTGYYSSTTQCQVAVGAGELMIMVQCPNWDLKNTIVATNRNASGSTRGFGGQELECAFNPHPESGDGKSRSRSVRCV